MFARSPIEFIDYSDAESNLPSIDELESRFKDMIDITFPTLSKVGHNKSKQRQTDFNSRNRTTSFEIGSFVMYRDVTPANKLEAPWLGPCKVLKKNIGGAYLLLDSDGKLLPRKFPPNLLKLVSSPDTLNDSVEVEAILDHSGSQNDRSYLVKWKGLDASHNLWVHNDDFNDFSIITQYWNLKKGDDTRLLDASSFKNPVGRPKGSTKTQPKAVDTLTAHASSSSTPKRPVGRPSKKGSDVVS